MSISRRDLLRGTAGVAAAGSLPLVLGAGNAVAASHPTLRTGSRGAAVLALQRRLTSLGYWLGAADGQFGDLTRQAVVAVQKVAGLARDGVCGPATWARVDAGV
jgi:N-acetylmuramoyl-L-alanine amidase